MQNMQDEINRLDQEVKTESVKTIESIIEKMMEVEREKAALICELAGMSGLGTLAAAQVIRSGDLTKL